MKAQIFKFSAMMLLATSVVSCGQSDRKSSGLRPQNNPPIRPDVVPEAEIIPEPTIDGSNIQGTYIAKFETLNSIVVGTIPGSAQFMREDDTITAYLRLFAGSPDIGHFQNVHSGSRCPTMEDDTNGDGFIDYQEAIAVVGPVIIPLDWDIGSQLSGNMSWPKAFPNGSYEYMKEANLDRLVKDLKSEDKNPNDNITKINPDENFVITGKVVIVQGVGENKILPETVAGHGRWRNFQTLPIACGIFAPNLEDPGVIYEETISGPIAPVIEGQDQPAPEGSYEIPGTGTVIEGPSNETGEEDSDSSSETEEETSRGSENTNEENEEDLT